MDVGKQIEKIGGFKFSLGEIVAVSPVPDGVGVAGRITALFFDEDGCRGYHVAVSDFGGRSGVGRHFLSERDVQKIVEGED